MFDHLPRACCFATILTATIACAAEPIFVPGSKPELLQEKGAGEGPAWHPGLGLLTSGDGNTNRRDKSGKTSVYRQSTGSNGLMFDRQGRLIMCEAGRRRVTRIEEDEETITVLATDYHGKKFNQPNDLTMDSKGRIYFSDPRYGDRADMEIVDDQGRKVEGVYRIDLDGKVTRIITHEVDRPNGLVVTHDDKQLFVADNNNNTVGGARKLWRFDLKEDGTVDFASQKLIHDWKSTRGPDGMKLDAAGRLYVAAGLNKPNLPYETADQPTAGIYVFSPEGELLEFAAIPRDETTNCAFGGDDLKTLFVTAGGTLWSLKTTTQGKPVWPTEKELFAYREYQADTQENFEKQINLLVAGIAKSRTLTVYEGLPHQLSEKDVLEKELKEKKTVKLYKFPFYEETIAINEDVSARLKPLCSDTKTYQRYIGAKFCGGFHPDWCVEFKDGQDVYRVLICFGCHEARLYGPQNDLFTDLDKESMLKLAETLNPLQKNRPRKPDRRGRVFGNN